MTDYHNKRKEDSRTVMDHDNQLIYNHIERIAHLESIQKIHADSILAMSDTMGVLKDEFRQVKWLAMGGVGFMVLQEVGLIEFVKQIFM